ncbi:MAG: bifunctional nuclease family protein [Actinobacteria bacterium]|nr:bifunctional nuclease family protein [Actinomycetota bacterium]
MGRTEVVAVIEVRIASLAVDSRGQPVVVLAPASAEQGARRLLPIWIGVPEATAIMLAVAGEAPSRPQVYDLMTTLLDRLDADVEKVVVTRLEGGTFFAEITLATPSGREVVDARPSDSIALAVRTGAPVFVAEAVFAEAGMPDADGAGDEQSQLAAFHEFLDDVEPDDFRG